MLNPGLTSDTWKKLVLDGGMIYHGATQQGVLEGRTTFDPGPVFRHATFTGKTTNIAGLRRIVGWNPVLTGAFKEFTDARFSTLNPGSTLTGVSPSTVLTPPDARVFLSNVANVRAIWDLGATAPEEARYFEIRLFSAFPTIGEIGSEDPGEGAIPVRYEAEALPAAPHDAPFAYYWSPEILVIA